MPIISDGKNEIYYMNFSNFDRPGYITQLGEVKPNTEYGFKNRFVSRHFFDYIVSGKGYVEFNGELHTVSQGDLVYIRKATVLSYGTDKNAPYEKIWLGADGLAVESLIDFYIGKDSMVISHGRSAEPFYKLKNMFTQDRYDERRVMRSVFDLILYAAKLPESVKKGMSERELLAQEIRQYIDDRFTVNFSIEELSAHFHVSKRQIYRLFGEYFNTTPAAYHNEIRLEAAIRYLSETSLNIGEIASALGFGDQSFFSASFKKKYGVYPSAYRHISIASPSPKE